MRSYFLFSIVLFYCFFVGCNDKENNEGEIKYLFEALSPQESGIYHKFGKLPHAGLEGGGVAVGDLNGNGLQDIFLVGDSLHGLYENLGDLKFENRFGLSGIPPFRGATSVVIWDINNDGKLDLLIGRRDASSQSSYVNFTEDESVTLEKIESNFQIFINKGNFKFEKDDAYKIDFKDAVSGIGLADFDKNGLTDIAISTWDVDFNEENTMLFKIEDDMTVDSIPPVKIFLQSENGGFYSRAKELGLNKGSVVQTSWSLFCSDFNNNDWVDLFVTNDFDPPDLSFINNEGNNFENEILFENTSFFSMGVDGADINNDGLLDYFVTDMRPYTYYRDKTVKYEKLFDWSYGNISTLIKNQTVKNMLYVNHGEKQFSEISEMIDADATEWSWSVLLADFNNNKHKDIFVSNGYYIQKFLEHDTPLYFDSITRDENFNVFELILGDTITADYFTNFFFSNKGDLDFTDVSRQWFKNKPLNTRGAAYADLDNDGDLELIFNNSKQYSVILKNNSRELNDTTTNYLRVKLDAGNKFSILHSKVKIYYNDEMQLQELNPCRGFYSSSEHFLHFGLDEVEKVDSLIVTWSNGKQTKLKTIHANQLLEVNYLEDELRAKPAENKPNSPFQIAEIPGLIDYQHRENDYLDFEQNLLLPQLYSRFGPYMAKGDISGNDLEDIIIGGAAGYPTEIYYQISSGVFRNDTTTLAGEKWKEDAGIAIFDINGDGMNDIYVASGGNEKAHGDDFYNHRYYLNKGKGKFQKYILPQINTSASVVRPGKIDNQTFVFVGGRVKAWEYPLPPESYLFVYEDGAFRDHTDKLAVGLKNIGMITDAIWTDFNGDENDDLIVVGEYMSPQFFQYVNGKLVNKTREIFPVDTLSGFWNSIETGDFNNDGKPDYVIGNLGLNTRYKASASYPLEIFAGDLDDNGSLDVITACYYEDSVLYPTKQLGPLKKKINGLSKKYYRYSDFGKASVYDVFGMENLESAYHLKAHTTASIYLQNSGDGKFDVKILPVWAQVAPIMDMLVLDFDKDGNQDIAVVGNFYHSEVERGQYTAQKGLILKGDGNGDFNELLPAETGLWADGDCRAIIDVDTDGEKPLIIVGRNNGKLSLYKLTRHEM